MDSAHTLPALKQARELATELAPEKTAIDTGLAIADHLLKLNRDTPTLEAAILYPSFQETPAYKKTITDTLGKTVYRLLSGAKQMDALYISRKRTTEFSQQTHQLDNLRKMLLAMVDDIRVVLVKLAERLVLLESLKKADDAIKKQAAQEVMDLYAPLANRLGVGQLKWQLEDFAFHYANPEQYLKISKTLNMRRLDREAYIQKMIVALNSMLNKAQIAKAEVSGRAKHIYSIYRKLQRKNVDMDEIYDSSAVRILLPTLEDCYTALSLVHEEWTPIPKEFDDYVAKPKPNGYRSIHTAVIGPEGRNVEIQIRTYAMHEESELGVAAHWKYKEGGKQSAYEQKINTLRDILDWQKEVTQDDEKSELYKKAFEDHIYVFTPNGDVLEMSAGSTPLDFAYHIHSEVGHRCRGAKINNHIATLTQELKTGDCVEVLTRKEPQPSRDWLDISRGYLKTAHARAKARQWFKRTDRELLIEDGMALWEKAYRREKLKKNDLESVTADFHMKTRDDLLLALGSGDIGIHSIINRLKPEYAEKEAETKLINREKRATTPTLNATGEGSLLTQLARCCHPIPGDEIIGYITQGHGVTIHQKNCRNMAAIFANKPERIMQVNWGKDTPSHYPVDLIIESENRTALVRDISNIILNEKIPLLGINTRANKTGQQAMIHVTVEINNLEALQHLINQLKQLPNVIQIKRKQ